MDAPRIIYIQLPIDATAKGEIYIPLLVHEIMHYVCPINRRERNKTVLKLFMKHYYFLMLEDLIECEEGSETLRAEVDRHEFVLAYFNLYETQQEMLCTFAEIGIPYHSRMGLWMKDVFTGEDLGIIRDYQRVIVPGHDCRLYRCRMVNIDGQHMQ